MSTTKYLVKVPWPEECGGGWLFVTENSPDGPYPKQYDTRIEAEEVAQSFNRKGIVVEYDRNL